MLLVGAQTSPTLDETISYIQKRVTATEGHQIIWNNGSGNYVMTPKFYCSGTSAASSSYMNGANKYTHGSDPGNWWYYNGFEFNLEYLVSVTEASGNTSSASPVGFIALNFSNNLAKKLVQYHYSPGAGKGYTHQNTENGNVQTIYLPYLKQDPAAFERTRKAILHLKSLTVKADPFAD